MGKEGEENPWKETCKWAMVYGRVQPCSHQEDQNPQPQQLKQKTNKCKTKSFPITVRTNATKRQTKPNQNNHPTNASQVTKKGERLCLLMSGGRGVHSHSWCSKQQTAQGTSETCSWGHHAISHQPSCYWDQPQGKMHRAVLFRAAKRQSMHAWEDGWVCAGSMY